MHNGYVLYVSDTETTGLDSDKHDIIEISMNRFILSDKITYDQKTWCLKPLNPSMIDDEALKVNGHKKEDLLWQTEYGKQTYLPPEMVISDIEVWMMEDEISSVDRIFAGQNVNFDAERLSKLWSKVNRADTFPFSLERGNRMLDTKQLAILVDLCTGRRRKYYNLSSLVKAFKVKKGKAHQAAEDVRMTSDLLVAILQPIQQILQATFKDTAYPEDE